MSIGDISIRYEEKQNSCYVFLSGTYQNQIQLDKTIKQLGVVLELMKQMDFAIAEKAWCSLKEAGY